MKQYVEVYWTPWTSWEHGFDKHPFVVSHVLVQQPDPLISAIADARPDALYVKCPAFNEVCRNGFVVRSPVDINIALNHEEKIVTTDRYGQAFHNEEIDNRWKQSNPSNPYLLSLFPKIVFYSKEPVEMEQLDLVVLPAPANVKTIPGKFDISKWVRPVEWAVEVGRTVDNISLRAGDPLYLLRFNTQNNVPVKLIRVNQTHELTAIVTASISVKHYRPKLGLKKLYALGRNYLEAFWRSQK